jgi:hypothetical protein
MTVTTAAKIPAVLGVIEMDRKEVEFDMALMIKPKSAVAKAHLKHFI